MLNFEPFKSFLLSVLLKIIYGLNKKSVRGRSNYLNEIKKRNSIIISVWHGHLLSVLYDLRNEKIHALAGTHKDADLISRVASRWGWEMIRGSSKEKGDQAYKKMIKVLNKPGSILFITPDGPAGPRRKPKPGVIRAAQATNALIIPTTAMSTKKWGFKNWDLFYLEKPFGKIFIEYGKPISFNKTDDYNTCVKILTESMNKTATQ